MKYICSVVKCPLYDTRYETHCKGPFTAVCTEFKPWGKKK